jgi:ribonuclease PH
MNVVMTGSGRLVEVQATAEGQTFGREDLEQMLDLAADGVRRLGQAQMQAALAARP